MGSSGRQGCGCQYQIPALAFILLWQLVSLVCCSLIVMLAGGVLARSWSSISRLWQCSIDQAVIVIFIAKVASRSEEPQSVRRRGAGSHAFFGRLKHLFQGKAPLPLANASAAPTLQIHNQHPSIIFVFAVHPFFDRRSTHYLFHDTYSSTFVHTPCLTVLLVIHVHSFTLWQRLGLITRFSETDRRW